MEPNIKNQLSEDENLAKSLQLALDLEAAQEQQLPSSNGSDGDVPLSMAGYMTFLPSADHMLFVRCKLEGHKTEMLVDSGASTSAISYNLVKKYKLTAHLNRSIAGQASGIGSANILGVLENVACRMKHVEFRLYFLVLDSDDPWVILGLDQMRRFKCLIDLERDKLIFGGKDGVEVSFLDRTEARAVVEQKFAHDSSTRTQRSSTLGSLFRWR